MPATPKDAPSTHDLLERARGGDRAALDGLLERYRPRVRRFAHGRLPLAARSLVDTEDLVQAALLAAANRLEHLRLERPQSFHSYLRQTVLNELRDQLRRQQRRPAGQALGDERADPGPSPLEVAIGRERLERYEAALLQLSPDEREAIVARLELGCAYGEVAEALGKPSPDAARMLVARACLRLARLLGTP